MTAAAANVAIEGLGAGTSWLNLLQGGEGPPASGIVIYGGSIVGSLLNDTSATPTLRVYVADGSMRAHGIALAKCDTTTTRIGTERCKWSSIASTLVDLNAGGGDALANTDHMCVIYGVDSATISKLAADGPPIGRFLWLDPTSGKPVVVINEWLAVQATRVTATAKLITDNTGGSASGANPAVLAAVTIPAALTENGGPIAGTNNGDLPDLTATYVARTSTTGGTADGAWSDTSTAVTGVDGSGSNAASKADVDTRLTGIANNFAEVAQVIGQLAADNVNLRAAIRENATRENELRTALDAAQDAIATLAAQYNLLRADVRGAVAK